MLGDVFPELGLVADCLGVTPWPPLDISRNSTLEFGAEVRPAPPVPRLQRLASPPASLVRTNATLLLWNLTGLAHNITSTGANQLVNSAGWCVADLSLGWVVGECGRQRRSRVLRRGAVVLTLRVAEFATVLCLLTSVHDHDPRFVCDGCSAAQERQIIGSEACMWATSTNATNMFSTVWPRLTAVAENMWTKPGERCDLLAGCDAVRPNDDCKFRRLRIARCRLLARGLPVPPVGGELYDPSATGRSCYAAREWQWCQGNGLFASYTPDDV